MDEQIREAIDHIEWEIEDYERCGYFRIDDNTQFAKDLIKLIREVKSLQKEKRARKETILFPEPEGEA